MWKFVKFERSHNRLKKYDAILEDRLTGKIKRVSFGAIKPDGTPYDQYEDKALGLFKKYDHKDEARRKRYYVRHAKEKSEKYSPSWFSKEYLW